MTQLGRLRRRAPIVEINMIPLIDVSLVLLIIFMVMTPFLVQQQMKVNLPKSTSQNEAVERPMVLIIQATGDLSFDGHAIAAGQLEEELKRLIAKQQDRSLMIQADKELPLQKIVSVMDIAKRAKVSKVGLSVEPPK